MRTRVATPNHQKLQNLIEKTVSEALGGGFKWHVFKALTNPEQRIDYAKAHLNHLGTGSSRIVFAVSSGKVLKIAHPYEKSIGAGIGQNKQEVAAYTDPSTKNIVAKVFDAADNYTWIVSELGKPLRHDDFEKKFGVRFNGEFLNVLRTVIVTGNPVLGIDAVLDNLIRFYGEKVQNRAEYKAIESLKSNKQLLLWLKNIASLVKKQNLGLPDMMVEDHYGLTSDGRLICLDYGFSEEIRHKHYMNTGSSDFSAYHDDPLPTAGEREPQIPWRPQLVGLEETVKMVEEDLVIKRISLIKAIKEPTLHKALHKLNLGRKADSNMLHVVDLADEELKDGIRRPTVHKTLCYFALLGAAPVGLAMVHGGFHFNIFISPNFRRQGLANKLYQAAHKDWSTLNFFPWDQIGKKFGANKLGLKIVKEKQQFPFLER